ncbi:MAG: hypothetical protein F4X11_13795 [Acidobacteria bacterium]|nr:hypothetical protein [Acidobacteriota bacterium]
MTEIGVQLPEIGVQLPPKPAFNFPRNRRSTSSDKPIEYGGDARFRLATTLAALFLPRPATGDDFRITRMLRRQSLVSAPAVIAIDRGRIVEGLRDRAPAAQRRSFARR